MDIPSASALIDTLDDDVGVHSREIGLLRSAAIALCDRVDEATRAVDETLSRYDADAYPIATLLVRFGHWKRRELGAFGELAPERLRASSHRREALPAILHLLMESVVEAEQLRLANARRLANEALSLSVRCFGQRFSGSRLAACIQADLLYEQNLTDGADQLFQEHVVLAGARIGVEGALVWYRLGARSAASKGQTAFAILLLREAEELGRQHCWTRLIASSLAERARVLLEVGRVTEAHHCLRRLEVLSSESVNSESRIYVSWQLTLTKARSCLATVSDEGTVHALHQMKAECELHGDRRLAVESQSLLACMLLSLKRDPEAREQAMQVLGIGAASGLYRTFLDNGRAMHRLLVWLDEMRSEHTPEVGALGPYLRSLVAAIPESDEKPSSARCRHRSGETLSARERQITNLISQGLSNKRIAKELGIAPETVKSHAKHILLKLGAQTRVEAVARAMSLGIL